MTLFSSKNAVMLSLIIDSIILHGTEVRDTAWPIIILISFVAFLEIGTILAVFQSGGRLSELYDSWKIIESGSARTSAQFTKSKGCNPSGPRELSGLFS